MTRQEILLAVSLAGRAPSPHNIQPARWRFCGDAVELHEDCERWLAVGDASGRDNETCLGMAWEGMALTLSTIGLRMEEPRVSRFAYPPREKLRCIARARLLPGAAADPLAGFIEKRRSYRGGFATPSAAFLERLDAAVRAHDCLLPVDIPGVAADYDAAALAGLGRPGFAEELYSWMRFSEHDSRAQRDGLSAACMGLSRIEAMAGAVAMRPAVFALILRLGLGRVLVSEAANVRSAARIVLVHADAQASHFGAGRAWYRAWLALDAAGAAGVPMSALCDSLVHARSLARRLPAGRRLVTVMRLGPVPADVPRSARLPPEELLIAA